MRRLAPLLCLLLAGCLDFPAAEACRDDFDCRGEKICQAGTCAEPGPRQQRDAAVFEDAAAREDAAAPPGPCGALRLPASETCVACLERSRGICGALQTCADDDICARTWTCGQACADPRCTADCHSEVGAEVERITLHTLMFRGCSAACELGRSWACVDAYDWGGADHNVLNVRLAIVRVEGAASQPQVDARVQACELLDATCSAPLAEAVSAANGVASLDIDVGLDPVGFTGYFAITGDTLMPSVVFPSARIIADGGYLQPVVSRRAAEATIAFATGRPPEPGRAMVLVQIRDCAGFPAPDLEVELLARGDSHRAIYFGANDLPDRELEATEVFGLVGFVDIPVPGESVGATLTARQRGTGTVVSRRQVLVRPDQLTFVFMGPDSRD